MQSWASAQFEVCYLCNIVHHHSVDQLPSAKSKSEESTFLFQQDMHHFNRLVNLISFFFFRWGHAVLVLGVLKMTKKDDNKKLTENMWARSRNLGLFFEDAGRQNKNANS